MKMQLKFYVWEFCGSDPNKMLLLKKNSWNFGYFFLLEPAFWDQNQHDYASTQFSTLNPSTRLNSFSLFVTRVQSRLSA